MRAAERVVWPVCFSVMVMSCLLYCGCGPAEPKAETGPEAPAPIVTLDSPPDLPPIVADVSYPPGTLTFTKDIAPIVFHKCATCHHQGEIAPFTLVCYQDVKKRAQQIVDVIQKRIMPPWAPLPGYCAFERDGALNANQIAMIAQWVEEGAVEGDLLALAPLPEFPQGWIHGQPDLVVTMSEPFKISADTRDVFRKFVIRVPIEETKYVREFEFDPGNRNVIHHMRLRVDESSLSRSQDLQDPLPGFEGTMIAGDVAPNGFFLGWTPGFSTVPKRADVAWTIQKGTDLVLELHLKGTGKEETVQSSIALYFNPVPPKERLHMIVMECQTIDIAPGKKDDVYEDQYVLPVDVTVLSIIPHAHFLGKDFRHYAVLPNGEKIWLMRMDDWDFNWQREYTYVDPISLPKGTTICMRITYDNSAENPRNPYNPPQRVMIGRETYDEMAQTTLQVQTANLADGKLLDADFMRKYLHSLKVKEHFLIDRGRETSESHYNLGCLYRQEENQPQALYHYQEAIRLNPDNLFAINNLGSIYRVLGKTAEAIGQYTRALEINPQDIRVRNNLGLAYLNERRLDEAEAQFEAALRISPELAEPEENLGVVAAMRGQFSQAAEHFERALKANPKLESARTKLVRVRRMLAGSR